MTDVELIGALSPLDTLTLTLWGEARSERVEGKVAVGCVVRNRLRAKRFGTDAKAVCLMPRQFSCWQQHDAAHKKNYVELIWAARALRNEAMTPQLKECVWVAGGILDDGLVDITRGACHYIHRSLWETTPPLWTKGYESALSIGNHIFFTGLR